MPHGQDRSCLVGPGDRSCWMGPVGQILLGRSCGTDPAGWILGTDPAGWILRDRPCWAEARAGRAVGSEAAEVCLEPQTPQAWGAYLNPSFTASVVHLWELLRRRPPSDLCFGRTGRPSFLPRCHGCWWRLVAGVVLRPRREPLPGGSLTPTSGPPGRIPLRGANLPSTVKG